MHKNTFSIIISITIISLLIGFVAGKTYSNKVQGTYDDGWNDAKKRLEDSGFFIDNNMIIDYLNGEIIDINNDKVTVKINPIMPLDGPDLDTRIITINHDTVLYQLKNKDPILFEKEMQEYNNNLGENEDLPVFDVMPPEPFIKEKISKNELKSGIRIEITASNDIRLKKEFQANEVIVLQPEQPLTV
jgi:hypothetical protein